MSMWKRLLLIQLFAFIVLPLLAWGLIHFLHMGGVFILAILVIFWIWQLFAFGHYRYCRQEEFLHVLQTAAATQAPVESVVRAYLIDRPREHLYRAILLMFVFPGYYWIHKQRSFDARLQALADLLDSGMPLDKALTRVPGIVSADTALAVSVGQFTGKLDASLRRLSDQRSSPYWVDWMRLLYPLFVLVGMTFVLTFMMIFIVPKFERMFMDFHLRLPESTEILIVVSRQITEHWYVLPVVALIALLVFNLCLLNSRANWFMPGIGWLYRMHARGRFLQTLGIMLESGKPLPEILWHVSESETLADVLTWRVERLSLDLYQGEELADSLVKHGLLPDSMHGLVVSAQKAKNLPWALQELGDSLVRRCARISNRVALLLFPATVLICAALVGFVSYAMFSPLVELIDQMADQIRM